MRVSSNNTAILQPDLYICGYGRCKKPLGSAKSLYRHLRSHFRTNEKKCPYCELCFTETTNLKAHVDRKHLRLRFECPEPDCTDTFSDKSALIRHRKKFHNYKTKLYQTTKDIIKTVQETRPGQLVIGQLSTLPATQSAATTSTQFLPFSPYPASPFPPPPPSTPPLYNDEDVFWEWYRDTGMPELPQPTEAYLSGNTGIPLEELSPTATMVPSSFFPFANSFQPIAVDSQASANMFTDYFPFVDSDPDPMNLYVDIFGPPQF